MGTPMNGASRLVAEDDLVRDLAVLIVAVSNEVSRFTFKILHTVVLFTEERRDSYSQNDRMVYISNIPYDVRWMEIKDLVREKAGEVVFVEILEDRFGKSKGAAVVEFRDKDSVQKCIDGLHRHQMKDRLVVAKEIRDPTAFFRKVKEDTGVDFLAPNGRLSRGSTGMGEEEEGCADLRSECRRLAPTTPSVSVLYSFANLASKDRCAIASLSLTYDPFSPVSFQLF
uniref:RRM domain-containing protein n=1 Tax=Plectus sambesii TaxID=2011161 RepID=A0A914UJP3_9BILA